METRLLVGGIAALSAFACLFASAIAAASSLRAKRSAMAARGEGSAVMGLLGWRLRNGFALTMPIAKRLSTVPRVRGFAEEVVATCAGRGYAATCDSALSSLMFALVVVVMAVWILTRSFVGGLAVGACAIAVTFVLMGSARDKRREAVREAIPSALESMAACFGSGFTLLQTFRQVSEEVPGRLGLLFGRSSHVLEMGGSAEQALKELREGSHASELAFVAVALDVQHQSGGSLKQVLDAASDSVKSELALRRSLRVQTAQAKLSARVVVVMPFILLAAFSLASPDFLAPFFTSAAGYVLLGVAFAMQAAGIVLVRRALSVDGVS